MNRMRTAGSSLSSITSHLITDGDLLDARLELRAYVRKAWSDANTEPSHDLLVLSTRRPLQVNVLIALDAMRTADSDADQELLWLSAQLDLLAEPLEGRRVERLREIPKNQRIKNGVGRPGLELGVECPDACLQTGEVSVRAIDHLSEALKFR